MNVGNSHQRHYMWKIWLTGDENGPKMPHIRQKMGNERQNSSRQARNGELQVKTARSSQAGCKNGKGDRVTGNGR
jgi:hypothetical protein